MVFIELPLTNGMPIVISIGNISAITPDVKNQEQALIYMSDSAEPFEIDASYISIMEAIAAMSQELSMQQTGGVTFS